ncbi:MAG: hypothetical protein K8R21_14495, partial [Leptospira sp.]|nr:hypothetical protein [Leptospira sp.]
LANTEKKETGSLIVKIGQNGIKILNSLLDNFFPIPLEISSPSMRSLNPLTGASITLQESLAESAKISYQLIKESPDTVFLTIQMNFLKIGHDYYVNLRKDDRFIISARVNSEGVVNFPGLLEGRYNIEFVGENFSKSFDVTIVTD